MSGIIRIFYLLGAVFSLMGLIFNLYPRLPRLPGDISIEKFGFKVYIPIVSSIIISVMLTLIFNLFHS